MTWGRDTDEHEAADQMRAYLDAGGNFIDTAAVYGDGDELAIISYANGYYLSRQAELELRQQQYRIRVIDLRTLVPLHIEHIVTALDGCRKVLIVDECRRRGSLSEELFTALHEAKPGQYQVQRLCAEDSFIPLGAAAYAVLPSKQQIVQQALGLLTVATEQVML